MRLVRLVSILPFAMMFAACGGGSGSPELVDASIDAFVPDAGPPPCNLDFCEADQVCSDHDSDEQHCGNCDTACSGGTFCTGGACECPPVFVVDNPVILADFTITQLPGVLVKAGGYPGGGVFNALAVGVDVEDPDITVTGMDYALTTNLGTPPFIGAAYNVNPQSMTADAAAYATSGTVNFTKICADGVSGTATEVHFAAVDSLTNPVLIEGGCSFDIETLTFSIGDVSCP
jgi:hypothetical protein